MSTYISETVEGRAKKLSDKLSYYSGQIKVILNIGHTPIRLCQLIKTFFQA